MSEFHRSTAAPVPLAASRVRQPGVELRGIRAVSGIVAPVLALAGGLNLAKNIYSGLLFNQGDFYYSLPGEYARRLNPTLWASPDMQEAIAFNHGNYLYGPTQYLTLFPIVYLDSYNAIAGVLLAAYALVLIATFMMLWKLLSYGERAQPVMKAATFAALFFFLPLVQAYIQREFEVVAFFFLICACYLIVRGREGAAGGLLAFITWFKYWPAVFVAHFVVGWRLKALAAFLCTTVVVLLLAQGMFGREQLVIRKTLDTIFWLVRPLTSDSMLTDVLPVPGQHPTSGFCRQWLGGRGTQVSVRWALCGFESRYSWLSARVVFYLLLGGFLAVFGIGAVATARRQARATPSADERKWTTIWQMSMLTILGLIFLHAHFYYLIVLALPVTALLYWYGTRPQRGLGLKLGLWAAAYLLLTAFLVPTTTSSWLFKRDMWAFYMDHQFYFFGQMLLTALVAWEFCAMAFGSTTARDSRPVTAA